MTDINLRARTTSEIVDAAFALYRQNLVQYITITAIAYSPALVLTLLTPGAMEPQSAADIWGMVPIYLVSFLTMSLVSGVVSRMGSEVYLGRDADIGSTIRNVLPRVPALIVATLINVVMLVFGFLLLVVPSVYLFMRNFALATVIVLEGKGPLAAFGRSGVLTKNRKWHIFQTLALTYGIYFLLSWGLVLLGGMTGSNIVRLLVSSLFNVFAYPVLTLVTVILYYDLRIRSEGFDLEHMTQALGAREPAAAY